MNTYPFAEMAQGLIAVKLTSKGEISVWNLQRPAPGTSMTVRYSTAKQTINSPLLFTMTVNSANVGLFSVEPDGWPIPYEGNIVHFLGYNSPFGNQDIPYQGTRPGDIPANRVMHCIFQPNGDLTLADGVGGSMDTIHCSQLNGLTPGSIWAAVRVTSANYAPACVTLKFTSGGFPGFSSTPGSSETFTNRLQFLLQP